MFDLLSASRGPLLRHRSVVSVTLLSRGCVIRRVQAMRQIANPNSVPRVMTFTLIGIGVGLRAIELCVVRYVPSGPHVPMANLVRSHGGLALIIFGLLLLRLLN